MRRYSIITANILCILLITSLVSCNVDSLGNGNKMLKGDITLNDSESNYIKIVKSNGSEDGVFQEIVTIGTYKLYSDVESGEFKITNSQSGNSWYSNPQNREDDSIAKGVQKTNLNSQMLMTFVGQDMQTEKAAVNTFYASSSKGGTVCYSIEKGLRIEYSMNSKEFSIPIDITLGEGYFEVNIPTDEINEGDTEFLSNIELLPYFCAAGIDESGYMLVPDGSGSLIDFNNGKAYFGDYNQQMYGSDPVFNLSNRPAITNNAKLPVFGMNKGDIGYFAIMTSGSTSASIVSSTSGAKNTYNYTYPSYRIRRGDTYSIGKANITKYSDKIDNIGDICIRYYLLEGDCSYNRMAKIYSKYLEETGMSPQVKEEDAPLFLEFIGSIKKESSVLGFPSNITFSLTTYKEMLLLLKELKQKIPGRIIIKYSNTDDKSISEEYPTSFSWSKSLGSRSERDELLRYCEDNNIILLPNINLLLYKNDSIKTINYFNTVRGISGSQSFVYEYLLNSKNIDYSISPSYLIKHSVLLRYLPNLLTSLKDNKIKGVSTDTLGSYLYSDYSKSHTTSREEALNIFADAAQSISKDYEYLMISSANSYLFPFADFIEDVPQDFSAFLLEDESIPFYQMTINNLVCYSSTALNFASDTQKAFLKALESGSALKFTWVIGDVTVLQNTDYKTLYALDASAWSDRCMTLYQSYNELYKATDGFNISSHEILDKNIHKVNYTNGSSLIINFTNATYTTPNGITVEPKSFYLIHGSDDKTS